MVNYYANISINFRELYLDGNNLQCSGAVELIKICAEFAEGEIFRKMEEEKRKQEEAEEAALRGMVSMTTLSVKGHTAFSPTRHRLHDRLFSY